MAKVIDMKGRKCGRLRVIERAGRTQGGEARWRCICRCEKETVVAGKLLRNGTTRSCGCLELEMKAAFHRKKFPVGIRQEIVPEIDDLHDLVKW